MKNHYIRIKYFICDKIKKLWRDYRIYIVILSVFLLLGLITGILTCSEFSKDLACENLINRYLYDFLIRELNWLSLFLIFGVLFFIICLLSMLLIRNKLTLFIFYFLLFLMSYVYGFDLCVLIVCLGLSGVFFGIIIYGLLGILVFLIYIVFLSYLSKIIFSKCNTTKKISIKACFLTWIIGLIILFFLVLFFSIIHIFVIVE